VLAILALAVWFAMHESGVHATVAGVALGMLVPITPDARGEALLPPPRATALGSLVHYLVASDPRHFQPMNVNFGLFPPVDAPKRVGGMRLDHTEKATARKRAYTSRAKAEFAAWLGGAVAIAAE